MMSYKYYLLLPLLLQSAVWQSRAQSSASNPWSVFAGVGIGFSDLTLSNGLTTGAYVGYEFGIAEVGLGFQSLHRHSALDRPNMWHLVDINFDRPKPDITRGSNAPSESSSREEALYVGSVQTLGLVLSVDPLKLIRGNTRHRLLVGGTFGHCFGQKGRYYYSDMRGTVFAQAVGAWTLGARLAYDYRLTERFGLGVSVNYSGATRAFFALGGVMVRF